MQALNILEPNKLRNAVLAVVATTTTDLKECLPKWQLHMRRLLVQARSVRSVIVEVCGCHPDPRRIAYDDDNDRNDSPPAEPVYPPGVECLDPDGDYVSATRHNQRPRRSRWQSKDTY